MNIEDKKPEGIAAWNLILRVVAFIVVVDNQAFFNRVMDIYPQNWLNLAFLVSLSFVFTGATLLIVMPFSMRLITKHVLIFLLITSSLIAYFQNNYGIVIDITMIQNIIATNPHEAMDLFHWKLLLYLLFLGLVPSYYVARTRLRSQPLKADLFHLLKFGSVSLLIIILLIVSFSKHYASFFREHKSVRSYANPTFPAYSMFKFVAETFKTNPREHEAFVLDAQIPENDEDRELIIFVVGETARADRFSLNGYGRETNPVLSEKDVISFSDVHSCGTSTAHSVPCIFSPQGRSDFKNNGKEANLIDFLIDAGVQVLWRDNNSNQKITGRGAVYQDYRDPEVNTICDIECRDEGMLVGLEDYIESHPEGDIFIVLHQMGNHGPAYYKRYPPEFEVFSPVCRTNQLENCSKEEIDNAYDNAILYTDYFLGRVIDFLDPYSDRFETAMVYFSDHGESLGEHNVYLHGLPYFMAPEAQKQVPAIMWFGESFHIDQNHLRRNAGEPYSHDHIFHTLMGLMEVGSTIYDPSMDIRLHGN